MPLRTTKPLALFFMVALLSLFTNRAHASTASLADYHKRVTTAEISLNRLKSSYTGSDMWPLEQHTQHGWVTLQDRRQQCPVSASDIDQRADA